MNVPRFRVISSKASKLERLIHPIYRLFDKLFSPPYNPFYRAGTVASLLLVALIASGLILVCFYSVSEPYESVSRLQSQPFFGRWLRAFHRYATVGSLFFGLLHFLQMILQSKSRGPWTLAWLSGLILIGVLFVSGWTGYVMVWDQFGQLIAMSGADLLKIIPFLREPLSQAFDGSSPVGASFFFMNLFLHVALPLGMFLILWIHLARLSRPVWFPRKMHGYCLIGILLFISMVWAAPLLPKADLLQMVGTVPGDILYGFWLPITPSLDRWWIVTVIFITAIFFGSFPWWWDRKEYPASVVDEDACTGCSQCVRDCPYGSIQMIPREDGRRLLAEVDPRICVSCGICAASCDDRAIGPQFRDGHAQLEQLNEFFNEASSDADESVVVCRHAYRGVESWRKLQSTNRKIIVYPVDCCGALHRDVLMELLKKVPRVFIHACPTGHCLNRDAYSMFVERLNRKRVPFLPKQFDTSRIRVASGDFEEVLEEHRAHLRGDAESDTSFIVKGARIALGIAICFGIALLSRVPLLEEPQTGLLRVSARLSGIAKEQCRALTEEEKIKIPKHMQPKEICETKSFSYRANVAVDGKTVFEKTYRHLGVRSDSPLFISSEVPIASGTHKISIRLEPDAPEATPIVFDTESTIRTGQVLLFKYNPTLGSMELSRKAQP